MALTGAHDEFRIHIDLQDQLGTLDVRASADAASASLRLSDADDQLERLSAEQVRRLGTTLLEVADLLDKMSTG